MHDESAHCSLTALHAAIIVIVGCAVLIPNLGQTVDVSDREGRHAEIAREMVASGQYVVPFVLGEPYFLKPPLFHWSVAAAYRLTGKEDFFTARLSSVVWALVGAVATYLLGHRWFGRRAALWGALLWLAFPLVSEWARTAQMDVMMAALVTVAVLLALYAITSRSRAAQWGLWLAACAVASGATLSKGPQALFYFLLAVAVMSRVYDRRWFPRPAFLAAGLGIVVVLCGGWLAAASARYPGYLQNLLDYQFGKGLAEHPRRVYLYVDQLLLRTAPWALFGIGAVYCALRGLRRRGLTEDAVPFVVFLGAFVAMTLVPNKREHYLLPILPFWALTIGGFLDRCSSAADTSGAEGPAQAAPGAGVRRWLFVWPLGVLLLTALVPLPAALFWLATRPPHAWAAAALGAAFIPPAAWGLLSVKRARYGRAVWALVSVALLGSFGTYSTFVEPYHARNASAAAAREIAQATPKGVPVACWGITDVVLVFALDRQVTFPQDGDALEAFLREPGTRYALVDTAKAAELAALAGACTKRGEWRMGDADIELFEAGGGGRRP